MGNDTLFFIINIFFFSLQMIISAYFIHCYLTPKFGIKSFINGFLILIFFIYLFMNYFYSNVPMRMILGVSFLEIVSWSLYDGKLFKKLLAGPIIFCCSALAELIIQFILVFILDIPIFDNLSNVILILIVFFNTLMFFIFTKVFLHLFSKPFLTTQQYSRLFLSSTISLFLIAIIISESLYINKLIFVTTAIVDYQLSFIILSICFILSLVVNIYIYYSVKSLKNDISKELISQLLQEDYTSQINSYLLSKNTDDSINHLRHDIMNYIQTVSIYKQEEDS